MTPLLLTLGAVAHLGLWFVLSIKPSTADSERANYLDTAVMVYIAWAIYFWIKVSDLIFGWSA